MLSKLNVIKTTFVFIVELDQGQSGHDYTAYFEYLQSTNTRQRECMLRQIWNSVRMVAFGDYELKQCIIRLDNSGPDLSQESCLEVVTSVSQRFDIIPLMDTITVINTNTIIFDCVVPKSKRGQSLKYKGGYQDNNNDKVCKYVAS